MPMRHARQYLCGNRLSALTGLAGNPQEFGPIGFSHLLPAVFNLALNLLIAWRILSLLSVEHCYVFEKPNLTLNAI